MTPEELAELLDGERQVRPWRRVEDLTTLTVADRVDFDDDERRLRGLL